MKKVGIDLTVGAAFVENVSLAVGATTEVVEVQAAVASGNRQFGSGRADGREANGRLPLNGRNSSN